MGEEAGWPGVSAFFSGGDMEYWCAEVRFRGLCRRAADEGTGKGARMRRWVWVLGMVGLAVQDVGAAERSPGRARRTAEHAFTPEGRP